MIPLYSPEKIKCLDNYAIDNLKMSSIVLMESAANSLKQVFIDIYPVEEFVNVSVICGKGNNAGDGFALARLLLEEGYIVSVFLLFESKLLSADAKIQFSILENINKTNKSISLHPYQGEKSLAEIANSDVIVDAILGSGGTGLLSESLNSLLISLNKIDIEKFSIDIPTGLSAETGYGETVFNADVTVTLGGLKQGLFFSRGYIYSGDVYLGSIGIPRNEDILGHPNVFLIGPEDVKAALPNKAKDIHKYSSGKLFTIAGSKEFPGAASLAASAAFRVGAGASVLAFPASIAGIIHSLCEPHIVIRKYEDNNSGVFRAENVMQLEKDIAGTDVISIGSGLGRDEATLTAVEKLITANASKCFVIDADALFAISQSKAKVYPNDCIVTPHIGEFSVMIDVRIDELRKDMLLYGRKFSSQTKSIMVLKDFRTLIFTPRGEVYISPYGNSGLAKFGSGDVLTGIIGGIYAQTKDALSSAICGVALHGIAADILKDKLTIYGFTATDLLNAIPDAIKLIKREK